ncbi:small RNA 2'-O-methyltransferase isoform X1 [Rhopalosiphum maidis]|uniref:small RNA 2'-O-methyltransferase isoform X1 n=2 Tax=Rhopalosiphum maidis TaxID=43146 RepID=UPI000EFFC83D|nr:small RNA 2'-O-methyltransferase isoform X1 [Rhopalosiphum maidis]
MLVIQSILLRYCNDSLGYMKSIINRYLCNGEMSDSEENKIIEIISQQSCACTLDENGLKFWPPLYMQRYMAIQEIIEHPIWKGSIKKVVDFGCSEIGLFKCIKPIPGLNNIMLVDVDFETLDLNQSKVLPTNYDHISMHERKEPLIVDIYNGSIADQDDRMLGVDAVICIELIEHLYLDVLDALPYTVFEFIKPKLAIFTTPNVEFNILFPNFTTQFRHDDHKFEWTRKQFKEWAKKITALYPEYAVQFDGIGAGPSGTENIGCCSQMAIFYRKDMTTSPVKPIGSTPYKLLRRVDYPYDIDDENHWKQSMYVKLRKFISDVSSCKKYIVGDNMEIPLSDIMPFVSDCCSSIDKLEDVINKVYFTTKNNHGDWLLIKAVPGFSSDEYESDSESSSNNSGQEYNLLENTVNIDNDNEDWNVSTVISSDKSKLCYSTPMTKNSEFKSFFSNVDSFNTVHSNSDLYKTAVDYNKSEDTEDMEISSSCNGSIIVEDCKVYQDFRKGRNSSVINEEDINETENTLTCVIKSHEFSNDDNKLNGNTVNDNTIIQNNSNISLKINCNSDTHKLESNNSDEEIDDQLTVCFNRTLLDENDYTENLLLTSDKELSKK